MNTLGIETSCDETAAAVVRGDRTVLASLVLSQIPLHEPYGGVVPEIASRSHLEELPDLIQRAVTEAGVDWPDIDQVAATYGPGLASSLLIGFSAAKGLALRLGIPVIAVNHLEAHIYSVFIGPDAPRPEQVCPLIALLVSGGHTCLVRVDAIGAYTLLGRTLDDAAGEAFDKGANLLDLGYPGGPAIDRISRDGDPSFTRFPRSLRHKVRPSQSEGGTLSFSFSGVKTALLYYLRDHPDVRDRHLADVAASYQEAIVDALITRLKQAARQSPAKALAVVGGVSLNSRLREKAAALAEQLDTPLLLAPPRYCTDNAAMIAALAGAGMGARGKQVMALDVNPNLALTA